MPTTSEHFTTHDYVNGAPPAISADHLNETEAAIIAIDNAKANTLAIQAPKTTNFAAAASKFWQVDTTATAVTASLPSAPPEGTRVAIELTTFGAGNNVTIATGGTDTFAASGAPSSIALVMQGEQLTLQYGLGQWHVVASNLPLAALDVRFAGGGGGGGTGDMLAAHALSEIATLGLQSTARGNLGLGSAAQMSSAAFDAAGAAAAAQAASAPVGNVLADVLAAATGDGPLIPGSHNPIDASGGNRAVTLGPALTPGAIVSFEKSDSSANTVTLTGSIRVAPPTTATLTLRLQNETVLLQARSDGSWWPIAGHKTLTTLDARYALPSQTGNAGKRLTTDGTSPAWEDRAADFWVPADNNLIASTLDPRYLTGAASTLGTGRVMFARIKWRKAATIQTLLTWIHTAGAGLTAGQNLMCLYTGAGVKIAGTTSSDQSTAWAATGIITEVLGSPVAIPADPTGYILAAVLVKGTTPPVFRGMATGTQLANIGLTAAGTGLLYGQDASTGNTALPATLTPSTATTLNGWFFALQ